MKNKERCFADLGKGKGCAVLLNKKCNGCNFYKPVSSQIEATVKEIKQYEHILSRQGIKTLLGQARAGDLTGALTGLMRLKNQGGL